MQGGDMLRLKEFIDLVRVKHVASIPSEPDVGLWLGLAVVEYLSFAAPSYWNSHLLSNQKGINQWGTWLTDKKTNHVLVLFSGSKIPNRS